MASLTDMPSLKDRLDKALKVTPIPPLWHLRRMNRQESDRKSMSLSSAAVIARLRAQIGRSSGCKNIGLVCPHPFRTSF